MHTPPEVPPAPPSIDALESSGNGRRFDHAVEIDNVAYLQGELKATWGELLRFLDVPLDEAQQKEFEQLCRDHFEHIVDLMKRRMFGNVVPFEEDQVVESLMASIKSDLDAFPNRGAVILDRAIHHAVSQQIEPEYKERISYLSITRQAGKLFTGSTGGKVARVGDAPIPNQVGQIAKEQEGRQVFLVDDTYVEGGTSKAARTMLAEGGVQLAPDDADRFYFRAVRDPNKPWKDAQAHVLAKQSVASAEAREFSSTGGSHDGAGRGNKVGFQIPAMSPFDRQGTALRLKNRLDVDSISHEILAIDIEYMERFQRIIGKDVMLFDIRRSIPTDAADENGRRSLPAEYMEKHYLPEGDRTNEQYIHGFITFLRQTKLTDYLRFAQQKLEEKERPSKDTVCVDMDGVIGKLRYTENELGIRKFHNSRLGLSVRGNAVRLAREVNGFVSDEEAAKYLDSLDTEIGLPGYFIGQHGSDLERKHGEDATARVQQIFAEAYAGHSERAQQECAKYLASMPLAYHVYRTRTWDHDMDDVYEHNEDAQAFSVDIKERGGKLVFVTAAPRIHAIKMLQKFGIIEALGPDGFELHTVEDLYDPEQLQQGRYVERDKGVIMRQVSERSGVDMKKMAMGGDQYRSDVHHPVAAGVQAALIEGPGDLQRYAGMYKLPRDKHQRPHATLQA
jgi:FMN phosphatase YigB (HAD superfamily)